MERGTWPGKKGLDFGGNPNHVALGLYACLSTAHDTIALCYLRLDCVRHRRLATEMVHCACSATYQVTEPEP